MYMNLARLPVLRRLGISFITRSPCRISRKVGYYIFIHKSRPVSYITCNSHKSCYYSASYIIFLYMKSIIITRFTKFLIIGVGNTAVDFLVLTLLLLIYPSTSTLIYLGYKTISFTVASINSYFWNKYWVFKSSSSEKKSERIRFALVSGIGLALNVGSATTAFYLAVRLFPLVSHIIAGTTAALFGTACGLLWNFIAYSYVVFYSTSKEK